MNIFAKIITFEGLIFGKVIFHTIQIEGKNETEYENFIIRHSTPPEILEDLINLQTWIEKIGNDIGAKCDYFRDESYFSTTEALPPPNSKMIELPVGDLRLYCMRVNEQTVILFNGGVKTTDKAQDCPNVRPYFIQANQLTNAIDKLVNEREITIDPDSGELIFDKDLTIYL